MGQISQSIKIFLHFQTSAVLSVMDVTLGVGGVILAVLIGSAHGGLGQMTYNFLIKQKRNGGTQ